MMGENSSLGELGDELLELEDRISDLPDSIIQHILSFLPSIREAVQTCVLSKRWKNQWTSVPVLTFDLSGMNEQYASRFVFSTLTRHECPKIQKFEVIKEGHYGRGYPHITESISFAVGKHTEEMVLDLFPNECLLPECIFNHSSLVNLNLLNCRLEPTLKVCWENLKELFLRFCFVSDMALHNILCGSPVLESLVIETCFVCGDHLVIDSKSLKKLELQFQISDVLEISCPNLEQLYLVSSLGGQTVKIKNSPSLYHVTLEEEYDENSSEKLLQQLQHVKSLKFGIQFIKFLSNLEVKAALSLPLLSNKCLSLCSPDFDKHSAGIARALHNSHLLEKLVITKVDCGRPEFPVSGENHWSWNNVVFTCLESHLKVVEILGFSKKCPDYKHALNFIEFILKNAKVLETLVVDFEFQVSLETRCSPHATVRVI